MSSISFPNGRVDGSDGSHEHDFFPSSFETSSVHSSFQMNPLSSHPPRTPRTSIIVGSNVYGTDIYNTQNEPEEHAPSQLEDDDASDDGDSKAQEQTTNRVRQGEVWQELFKTAYGRDKVFKVMQYSLRMYLLFHASVTAAGVLRGQKSQWEARMLKRIDTAIGSFSLTRKCLILFNWLPPLNSILAQHTADPFTTKPGSSKPKPLLHTFLHTSPPVLLELVNGVSDDVATFSKLGLVNKTLGEKAGQFADWCWFVSSLVNLVENSVERSVILAQQHQVESRLYDESMGGATAKSNPTNDKLDRKELARLQRQDYWIQMSRLKLIMDLIFVSYNVFRWKRAKGPVQTFTGLAAALLSTAKVFDRHKGALVKARSY
ncbi:hypothetical protein BXZ70DRAFT_425466 [Cristinia sonorae]|uniref:Peroxisomal biogenesis factor 11 n=1 Tax=Cristinia sonorae TaxID=1940300 RepID=A0A8K0XU56_9AGAR|nr:hypothetical protein BXZ70DRAFT_425466 [Cristinia sonorae]